jgi:hypothetical protein
LNGDLLRSRTPLFASFSGKRRRLSSSVTPLRGELVERGSSAKQNTAFCFFFWKKKSIDHLPPLDVTLLFNMFGPANWGWNGLNEQDHLALSIIRFEDSVGREHSLRRFLTLFQRSIYIHETGFSTQNPRSGPRGSGGVPPEKPQISVLRHVKDKYQSGS